MKKIFLILGVILSVFCFGLVVYNIFRLNPASVLSAVKISDEIHHPQIPLKGETLRFNINFMYMLDCAKPVIQTGQMFQYNEKNAYPVTVTAKTGPFASKVCKAYAQLKSFVEPEHQHTLRYEELSQAEGHSLNQKAISYDQDTHIMTSEGLKRLIPEHTQDPVSILMYLRTRPFAVGKSFNTYVNSNQENYYIETTVKSLESFQVSGVTVKMWRLRARLSSQKEYDKSRAAIDFWITADDRRLPVMIRGFTMAGIVVATLEEVSIEKSLQVGK